MSTKRKTKKQPTADDRLAWWREARFGMFIHWGLYAVPAGVWKGQHIGGIGEWIMRNAKIPIPDYEAFAEVFNPVRFDAEQWISLAKEAGMKYLVITSKHHDGFCMFRSKSNPYNIVDATPFGRDPMAELAKACRKAGIKLCFYYSQAQDWHAPGGAGHWEENHPTKNWHGYTRPLSDFAKYLETVVKPNVRELLTQYGKIGLIWFDTPAVINKKQSEALRDLVHEIQPDCLVSGRVGHNVGDYGSMGDNQIPPGRVTGDWETPATLNDTWGFKTHDHNWKSVDRLLYLLVDLASKGVNYLLNVGPTAKGEIPGPSIQRLKAVGKWTKTNGAAIYGTTASPYPYEFDWGRITQKPGKLYLHFFRWPKGRFVLFGLRNKVRSARLLRGARAVPLAQTRDTQAGMVRLEMTLPKKRPDRHVSVVELDIAGNARVDALPSQQDGGRITLPAFLARCHVPKTGRQMVIDPRSGTTTNWHNKQNWLSWEFRAATPGTYRVQVVTAAARRQPWQGGHKLRVTVGRRSRTGVLKAPRPSDSPRAQYHPEYVSELGRIRLDRAGKHRLTLKAESINNTARAGIRLVGLELFTARSR